MSTWFSGNRNTCTIKVRIFAAADMAAKISEIAVAACGQRQAEELVHSSAQGHRKLQRRVPG
jgi:F420-dependent methylenetetrahydromethanopterin dehydrogenase